MAWICPFCNKAAGQSHACKEGFEQTEIHTITSLRQQLTDEKFTVKQQHKKIVKIRQQLTEAREEVRALTDCGSDDVICLTHKSKGIACNKHMVIAGNVVVDEQIKERERAEKAEQEVIELCRDSHANRKVLDALVKWKDAEQENKRLLILLKVAKCPACDGSGAIGRHTGGQTGCPSDYEWEQCQWCDEREQELKEEDKCLKSTVEQM
jgi:hypothetical protein